MSTVHNQIRVALGRSANGLTARQIHALCDESGTLNELVSDLSRLKGQNRIKADGMRDSQVIYKIGVWPAAEKPEAVESVHAPEPEPAPRKQLPAVKVKRSGANLREGLFDMMERLRDGKVDVGTAKTYAALAMTICKSIEVQLEYERMRVAKELDGELGDMPMVPELEYR
jgi:hypothetical protein